MDSSRTNITMIELLLWWSLLGPMLLISIAYLLVMGWSSPRKIITVGQSSARKIIQVYSADTNRVDETGGPYEVEIKDN